MPDPHLDCLDGARVLVTGGGGLVGSRIVRLLAGVGAEPVVLDRMDAYPYPVRDLFGLSETDMVLGDVRDAATVRTLTTDADYVIHAAAYADVAACTRRPEVAFAANVAGTQTVLQEVLAAPAVRRLVFISSASVYGDPARAGGAAEFTEDQPTHPISVYANSKLWGEHQVRLMLTGAATEYTVLRYFSVYGDPQVPKPGSHSWMVACLAMRAHLGMPLQLNGGGHQVRDMVHVDDIARATVLALIAERAASETINVGSGIATSVRQIAERVATHYPSAQLIDTPRPEGDPLGGYASTTRSQDLLGWQPRITVDDGIDRYVNWLQATPEAIPPWLGAGTVADVA
ncbi:UDP-glucose 4-epimerase/dTDP-L-rhamnose 4-epimerase [Streptosporangium becharense]|uniref:UDP-glucose 4-epimerase/dTDP-L-rhamnose 4-epimerase n=1 Tax=Streptosporangium becharense TaxID=1816182 RepID=A0A7W9MEF9_9ACTN|nr:NAD-dependent epimerase/dehydratase family protein [Streptosporangium becharense]MBB2910591.1 UDP-glucose 4-epimerase/dTDP-L-rhamnose 4-epimerase [Streptosporangium becharense]MBB5817289.1 UDP-glucose 4-epimerase/dTDP-L-rhamnose 4-epimerase [Streptosporangium becharense]